jgi:hypothetical protein
MKRASVILGLCLLALLVVGEDVLAQVPQAPQMPLLRVPRISQGAKVTQVIGLSEVTIFYHRPGVKGREIWGPGKLLPYDSIWRAGANEPTLFTFSDPVTIERKTLPAGTYRFLTIPGSTEWTVIFNSEVKNWGTDYEPKYDMLRFKVNPEVGPHEEWLSFSFTALTPSSARAVLAWEKVRIGFKIEFNTLGKLEASLGTWQELNGAARDALTENVYQNEAMTWIERSIALDKNEMNLRTKAELLAAAGRTPDAIAAAEEAMKIGKLKDPKFESSQFAKDLGKLIDNWKANK